MGLLEELAVRCEAAGNVAFKGPVSWQLNGDIVEALGLAPDDAERGKGDAADRWFVNGVRRLQAPNYTMSLDAARSIWDEWDHCEVYRPDHQTLGWTVHLFTNANRFRDSFTGFSETEAMAWTIASLSARHALALSKGSEG